MPPVPRHQGDLPLLLSVRFQGEIGASKMGRFPTQEGAHRILPVGNKVAVGENVVRGPEALKEKGCWVWNSILT